MTKSPFNIGDTVIFSDLYEDEYGFTHTTDAIGTITAHHSISGHIISFINAKTGMSQEVYCITEDLRLQLSEEFLDQMVEL